MRVVGDGVISDWIWISFGTVVAKPPLHVVHVICPGRKTSPWIASLPMIEGAIKPLS